jgi:sodium transport system permease protein
MNFFRVWRKELIDITRDRRTIIAALVVPVLIVPLMLKMLSSDVADPKMIQPVDVAIRGSSKAFVDFLKKQESVKTRILKNNDASETEILCEIKKRKDSGVQITVKGDSSTQNGMKRLQRVIVLVQGYADATRRAYTDAYNIPRQIAEPVTIDVVQTRSAENSRSLLLLGMLIPVLLIVFAAASPLPVAADLFAGEKERGTMEPLLCTPVGTSSIVFGKFAAAVCTGIVGVAALFAGLWIASLFVKGLFPEKGLLSVLTFSRMPLLVLNACMTVLFFTAIESAICIFSRSTREAQTLSLPILICAAAAGSSAVMSDLNLPLWRYMIPGHSNALIMRQIIYGTVTMKPVIIMAISSAAGICIAAVISYILFTREKIIFRS